MKLTVLFCITFFFSHGQQPETKQEMMDKIIQVSAALNCPLASAFEYFSKNELLERWLTAKADVDMKPGGKYELFWSPDDPDLTNNSTYGCKVLSVNKPYYFSIEWTGNKDHKSFMNVVRPLTNVTVFFSKVSDTKTIVTLLHTGWRTGKDWDGAYQFFTNAWNGAFRSLENLVNKGDTERKTSEQIFCYYLKLTKAYEDPARWTDETEKAIQKHAQWLDDLGKQGILLFAGRTLLQPGDEHLFGIAIFKAPDISKAKALMAADPAVVAGIQKAQVFPYLIAIQHFENILN